MNYRLGLCLHLRQHPHTGRFKTTSSMNSSAHSEMNETQHYYSESEYSISERSSVEDWSPESAEPSDLEQSDIPDDRSSSEASTEQTYVSDTSEERLDPNLTKTRVGACAERLGGLTVDYHYRVHTEQPGLLYGLCDAVPYLLGTRQYLDAIVTFDLHDASLPAFHDQGGESITDLCNTSTLDKVFMTMLWLLRVPVSQRPEDWEDHYAGMTVQDDRMIVYKDMGFGT
jgi:hypothetical protein